MNYAADKLSSTKEKHDIEDAISEVFEHYNENILLGNRMLSLPDEIKKDTLMWKLKLNSIQTNTIWIVNANKHLSMSQLAEKQAMHKQAITKYVLALVKMGILRRFQKEDNYRYVYVEITDYGKEILENTQEIMSNYFFNKFTSIMSLEDIKEFAEICKKKNEFMNRLK